MCFFAQQNFKVFQFICLSLLVFEPTIAQPPAKQLMDSLKQSISSSSSIGQKIQLMTQLGVNYFGTQPDSGRMLARQAIELARKEGMYDAEAEARIALAACLWGLGQHLQAIDEYRLALPVAQKSGNKKMEARIQQGIAINYGAIDKKDKAVLFLRKSLELQLQVSNDSGAMGCFHNLAHYSNEMAKKQEALFYYQKALLYAKRAKHERGVSYTLMQLGSQQAELGKPDQGIELLKTAEQRFQAMKDTSGMADCWALQGKVNQQLRRYQEAISCYLQAIQLQLHIKGQFFRRVLSGYYMNLAEAYEQSPNISGKFQKSKQAWSKSLKIAKETDDWKAAAKSARALSGIFRKNGQPGLALDYYEEYIRYRDLFQNIEQEKEASLHELQTQYNDSIAVIKKLQDKQLTIVRQEAALREAAILQNRLYALAGLALLAFFLSILLYRNRLQQLRFRNAWQQAQQEQERKTDLLQKKNREVTLSALQAQMNPHFIFNGLNVIQSFVYAGEKEEASQLIGKFSDLVRQTLHFSRNPLISLEEELAFIRAYVELEMQRMTPELSVEYKFASDVNLANVRIPPLLVQPFVENALRHGLYHKEGVRWLRISVEDVSESILIKIDDNGVGRNVAKKLASEKHHLAFASEANMQRMTLLKQLNELNITISTSDKRNESGEPEGTTVRIFIASPSKLAKV